MPSGGNEPSWARLGEADVVSDAFDREIVGLPNCAIAIAAWHGLDLDSVAGLHNACSLAWRLERLIGADPVDRGQGVSRRKRSRDRNHANKTPKLPSLPRPHYGVTPSGGGGHFRQCSSDWQAAVESGVLDIASTVGMVL